VWIFPRTSTRLVFFLFYSFFNVILLFYKNNNYCPPDQTPKKFSTPPFFFRGHIYKIKNYGMQQDTIWTVLITLIGVLGGGSAWRYYEKRAMRKERDEEFIRHDCKDRIAKLEILLENSSREKDEMRATILKLTEQVSALAVKVEFLQRENNELMKTMK